MEGRHIIILTHSLFYRLYRQYLAKMGIYLSNQFTYEVIHNNDNTRQRKVNHCSDVEVIYNPQNIKLYSRLLGVSAKRLYVITILNTVYVVVCPEKTPSNVS